MRPMSMSDDGGVIGGTFSGAVAGIYTRTLGIQRLTDYFGAIGIDYDHALTYRQVIGVSADGSTLAVLATTTSGAYQSLLVEIPSPCIPGAMVAVSGMLAARRRRC